MGFIGIHTGQKAERDTGSILLKPGTAKNSFQGMEQTMTWGKNMRLPPT